MVSTVDFNERLNSVRHLSDAHGRSTRLNTFFPWALLVLGMVGLIVAVAANTTDARLAADQDWSPFVLVTGLLLIGMVANDDGLFAAAGHHLARISSNGLVLFIGAAIMIGSVTAVLNLDTSVAFLTPVLIYTARSRGGGEAPLLYGCLLLSNAGSLFLPGSNLTNLIVLGHVRMSGAHFFSIMWAPALAALLVTAIVIALIEHRELRLETLETTTSPPAALGLGLVAVIAAAVLVLVLPSPALAVAAVGVIVVVWRLVTRAENLRNVFEVVGVPVLAGLFGVAVALGTLGRLWSGPATLLSHLDTWSTAGVAALVSVVVNNLPAASLLAARTPAHPFALLIGLNLGPNLLVSGSLAWILWLKAARIAGARPSLARASRLGLVAVPLAMAAALAILSAKGLS
jgi:arsenical pump membrane protein